MSRIVNPLPVVLLSLLLGLGTIDICNADFVFEIDSTTVDVNSLTETATLGVYLTPVSPSTGVLNFTFEFQVDAGLSNVMVVSAGLPFNATFNVINGGSIGDLAVVAGAAPAVNLSGKTKLFDIKADVASAITGQSFDITLVTSGTNVIPNPLSIQDQTGTDVQLSSSSTFTGTIAAVPEPSTWILGFLLATGSVVAGWDRWKKREA
jgi:hypothetical protein